jgi:CRISPR system Cascade subunit CasB
MNMRDESRIAAAWWRRLQPDPDRKNPGDRAALARLRRVTTPTEAAMEPACVALARDLQARPNEFETVALTAAVLAHLRENTGPGSLARHIGVQPDGTSPISWLRVRRLVQAHTLEDRLTAFRRLVNQMSNKAPLYDLADCLLDWSEMRRRQFVFDFHSPPLPALASPAQTKAATQEPAP